MAPRTRTPIERFLSMTKAADNGCIEWIGYKGENGYGRFYFEGRGALAHRWSYEHHVGPIPDGLVIDHLCRNRGCVNHEHLEPVTTRENIIRGEAPVAARGRAEARTHCRRGHAYDEENTRITSDGGRLCLTCKRIVAQAHYQRNRDTYIAKAEAWRLANPERARELSRQIARKYRAKKKAEAAE